MSKPSLAVVVKNVSKGPTMLSAQGYAKVFLDAGKSHTFEDGRVYEYYKKSAQGLKEMGLVEIIIGGAVDKAIPTPKMDEQAKVEQEAAAASKMDTAPAPVPEDEEAAEAAVKKPAPKKK